MVLDAAAQSSVSSPSRRLEQSEPDLAAAARKVEQSRAAGEEASWGDLLKPKVVREALRFLSDKTGSLRFIITQFLSDVAYYLEDDAMRDEVQAVVTASLAKITDDGHSDVVVVGHSLGELPRRLRRAAALRRLRPGPPVRDGGLPRRGYAAVKRNLWGGPEGRPNAAYRQSSTRSAAPCAGSTSTTSTTSSRWSTRSPRCSGPAATRCATSAPRTRRTPTRSRTTCPIRTSPAPSPTPWPEARTMR